MRNERDWNSETLKQTETFSKKWKDILGDEKHDIRHRLSVIDLIEWFFSREHALLMNTKNINYGLVKKAC